MAFPKAKQAKFMEFGAKRAGKPFQEGGEVPAVNPKRAIMRENGKPDRNYDPFEELRSKYQTPGTVIRGDSLPNSKPPSRANQTQEGPKKMAKGGKVRRFMDGGDVAGFRAPEPGLEAESMRAAFRERFGREMPESDVAAWQATGGKLKDYTNALEATPEFADRYHQVRRSMRPDDPSLQPMGGMGAAVGDAVGGILGARTAGRVPGRGAGILGGSREISPEAQRLASLGMATGGKIMKYKKGGKAGCGHGMMGGGKVAKAPMKKMGYASGGKVCRGMGTAKRGGSYC